MKNTNITYKFLIFEAVFNHVACVVITNLEYVRPLLPFYLRRNC